MEFIITEFISQYVHIDDEFQKVEVDKEYRVKTWDDLSNLILTLIDFSEKAIKFEVQKKEVKANE